MAARFPSRHLHRRRPRPRRADAEPSKRSVVSAGRGTDWRGGTTHATERPKWNHTQRDSRAEPYAALANHLAPAKGVRDLAVRGTAAGTPTHQTCLSQRRFTVPRQWPCDTAGTADGRNGNSGVHTGVAYQVRDPDPLTER